MAQCLKCFKKKCDEKTCTHVCHKFDQPEGEQAMTPEERIKHQGEATRDFLGL